MTFQPLSAVVARITAELARGRAERIDRADDNLREFLDRENDRLRDLERRARQPKVRA